MTEPGVARTLRITGETDSDGLTPIVWTHIEHDGDGDSHLVDGEPDRIRIPRLRPSTDREATRAALQDVLRAWHR